jgi:hypothetical protein
MLEIKRLQDILGEENVEILKKNIIEIITETIKRDFEESSEYLITPSIVEQTSIDCLEEVKEQVKKELYPLMLEQTMKKLNL